MDDKDSLNQKPTRHITSVNLAKDFPDVTFDENYAINLTSVLSSLYRNHKYFCGYNPKLYILPTKYKEKNYKEHVIGPISPEHFYYNLFEWDHVEIICEADPIFGYGILEILMIFLIG